MVSGQYFQFLSDLAQELRGNNKPFGGIQVIACGDFYQLPPVCSDNNHPPTFAFEAPCWDGVFTRSAQLTKIFRQKSQGESVRVSVRCGLTRRDGGYVE